MPGIDDMAFHVPKIYLPIEELADKRAIAYAKLNKGLGLEAMSLADVHEDASTMAANAVKSLIEKNELNPTEIGRIYVGSESAFDGAKPIASYVLSMLTDHFEKQYGENAFLNTDVVDMTFACIAGVDALHNTLDWVAADTTRMGIVVCTDNAKYELESTGEYTQGAGAVAMLVKDKPRLIEIDNPIGVATVGVHDFFKPVRRVSKQTLVDNLAGKGLNGVASGFSVDNVIASNEKFVDIHKIFPVFDGQYSNECYSQRMQQAYTNFCDKKPSHHLDNWDRVVFHLPYAFHGKRVFSDVFYEAYKNSPELKAQLLELAPDFEQNPNTKLIAKTPMYQQYVTEKIEKAQRASSLIGNLYTGSIFMALMSMLESEVEDGMELENKTVGFCSYGSGSKSKVFEGKVQPEWKSVVEEFNLFLKLSERQAISFELYEKLHNEQFTESVLPPENEFYLKAISTDSYLYGKRTYAYAERVLVH